MWGERHRNRQGRQIVAGSDQEQGAGSPVPARPTGSDVGGAPVEESAESVGSAVGRGLAALLTVAVAVGLLFGGGILVLTKMLGVGSDSTGTSQSSAGATLYMGESTAPAAAPSAPSAPATKPGQPEKDQQQLTITVDPAKAAAMTRITLSGTSAGSPGALLTVERKSGSEWSQFAGMSVTVRPDGTWSTWIQTGVQGQQVFRVSDQDRGISSSPVTVTIT